MASSHEPAAPPADLHTPDPAVVKQIRKAIRSYIIVFAILLVGTWLTVYVAGKDFGSHTINITIGLLIATVKASAVALIFMHLNHERGLIYKTMLFCVILFAALMFLTVLHHYAYIDWTFYPTDSSH